MRLFAVVVFCILFSKLSAFYLLGYHKSRKIRSNDNAKELAEVYLKNFGYLPPNGSNFTNKEIEDASKNFQRKAELAPTGEITEETLKEMKRRTPKCGVSDNKNMRNEQIVPWKEYEISYKIYNPGATIAEDEFRSVIRQAFDLWSSVIQRRFVEVEDPNKANIKIRFYRGEHGDNDPFTGEDGVYAHAFIKGPTGTLHLNSDSKWKKFQNGEELDRENMKKRDILFVVIHEIGHVLGLDHFDADPNSVMVRLYKKYKDAMGKYLEPQLCPADIQEIQNIYGGKKRLETTHIANGGHHYIYVAVEKDKNALSRISSHLYRILDNSRWFMEEIPTTDGFTEIKPGMFKAFHPLATSGAKVYITIVYLDGSNGNVGKLVDAYEVISDQSIVIGYDNQVHNVEPGRLWYDENGKNHFREPI